jgi:hypothetical protein
MYLTGQIGKLTILKALRCNWRSLLAYCWPSTCRHRWIYTRNLYYEHEYAIYIPVRTFPSSFCDSTGLRSPRRFFMAQSPVAFIVTLTWVVNTFSQSQSKRAAAIALVNTMSSTGLISSSSVHSNLVLYCY